MAYTNRTTNKIRMIMMRRIRRSHLYRLQMMYRRVLNGDVNHKKEVAGRLWRNVKKVNFHKPARLQQPILLRRILTFLRTSYAHIQMVMMSRLSRCCFQAVLANKPNSNIPIPGQERFGFIAFLDLPYIVHFVTFP